MNLTVIGCGKMGLPIAVQAASRGLRVIGVDADRSVVESINSGKSHIGEPGIERSLRKAVKKGALKATTDTGHAVSRSDAVIVIVPVLLNGSKEADLTAIRKTASEIAKSIRRGTIVSFETTLPVGTTRKTILPILEKSGLKAEKDFYLVFSPERVKSNMVMRQMRRVPKIVGGIGPLSLKKGIKLYSSILTSRVVGVPSPESAEMIKIAGMVYRDVNIALANEIAGYCDKIGIDLNSIIPLINTDGEANLLYPGVGVGGHCAPVYPYFLINDSRRKGTVQVLALSARSINDSQAGYAVSRLRKVLGNKKGSGVLILGLGFRPDVKEDAYSTAYLLKGALKKYGFKPCVYDPLYTKEEIEKKEFVFSGLYDGPQVKAVILVTAHSAFSALDWKRLYKRGVRIFIDGRNRFEKVAVKKAGIKYIGIGKG